MEREVGSIPPSSGPAAYLGSVLSDPSDAQQDGRTDGQTGRAGESEDGAARRQGRTLKPEPGSDKGWSGGRGRGRAAGGRAGPVRAAPSLRSSGAKLGVNGGPGAGPGGPGGRGLQPGQWERGAPGPRRRDWRSAGRGGAEGARAQPPERSAAPKARARQARGRGRRETIPRVIEAALAR